jgi:hypothetical protein
MEAARVDKLRRPLFRCRERRCPLQLLRPVPGCFVSPDEQRLTPSVAETGGRRLGGELREAAPYSGWPMTMKLKWRDTSVPSEPRLKNISTASVVALLNIATTGVVSVPVTDTLAVVTG